MGPTAYRATNQAVKLGWKNDGHLVDFKYGYQHIPYEAYPNQRMDMTDNRSDQFNLGYNLDTYPTCGVGGLGNQTRDAALFNAPFPRQDRQQLGSVLDRPFCTRRHPEV